MIKPNNPKLRKWRILILVLGIQARDNKALINY